MSDIYWNMNFEAWASGNLAQGSGVTFGHSINDHRLAEPFVKAINERMRVLPSGIVNYMPPLPAGGTYPYRSGGSTFRKDICQPTSGYYSIRSNDHNFLVDVSLFAGGPGSPTSWYNLSNPVSSTIPGGSGWSWGEMQSLVATIAPYFVANSIDGETDLDYDGKYGQYFFLKNHSYETFFSTIQELPYYFAKNVGSVEYPVMKPWKNDGTIPSGISSFTPSLLIENNPDPNDLFIYTELVSTYESGVIAYQDSGYSYFDNTPSGGGPLEKSLIYKKYLQDEFPRPSGFRRYYPREIWSIANSGSVGQTARLIAKNSDPFYGLFEPTKWYQNGEGSGFKVQVKTPDEEVSFSNSIFEYIDSSGWVKSENQSKNPDLILDYGIAQPGDYMGPWILNDLRDAINQLVWTYGIELPLDEHVYNLDFNTRFYKNPLKLLCLPSFNILRTSYNLDGDMEITSVGISPGSEAESNPCFGEGTDASGVLIDGLENLACRAINLDYYGIYASGEIAIPHRYTFFDSNYYGSTASGVETSAYSSSVGYSYIKPSGINVRSNGVQRKYEFYSIGNPAGGHNAGLDPWIKSVKFNKFGYDVDFKPDLISYDFTDYGNGSTQNHPLSGATGWYVTKKVGEMTTDKWDKSTGISFGDTSLTPESDPSYFTDSTTGGWEARSWMILTKWDVPSGFIYTKSTPSGVV